MIGGVTPTRLRRRLAVVFVLAVGVTTGGVALGSYLIVRNARLDDSTRQAVSTSIFNLRFASAASTSVPALLDALRTRGSFSTVILSKGARPESSARFGPAQIPSALRALVDAGQLGHEPVTVFGRRYLVVGSPLPKTREQLYFFFDEQQVWDDLDSLRNVLLGGWVASLVLAALGGSLLARRTLAPVARASHAAQALAEGLLDTRLPAAGKDEFAAWAASFNGMADALEEKIGALSEAQARERRFTANVAHELRTPLAALVAESQLLVGHTDAMPAEAGELAGLVVADVARLKQLAEDLLEISRLDSGVEQAEIERVDVAALAARMLRVHGWADAILLQTEPSSVETDRRRLERIITNLVDNAMSHGGGGVEVGVWHDGEDVVVEVADHGPGISARDLPHVFERFFKADHSRSASGTGLGLAIARENALLLGAELTAAGRDSGGAVFKLRMPVTRLLPAGSSSVIPAGDTDSSAP